MAQTIIGALLGMEAKTLIAVLFWGNLISVFLVFSFYLSNRDIYDKVLSTYCVLAKLCQASSYFLFLFRGLLPNILSLHIGNSLLFIGFFWEGLVILAIARNEDKRSRLAMACVTLVCMAAFNVAEILHPNSPSFRVAVASLCIFFILLIPICLLVLAQGISTFQRVVSLFYIAFLVMLLPRAVEATLYQIGILSNSLVQALTFLSLVFVMLFSLSAYLLVEKESVERLILSMANTDALTGLANRCSFMADAERMFEAHKVNGSSHLAVLFIDLDDFKQVNDVYGHVFGDEVLKRFGDILKKELRVVDLKCRYGGEEFVTLLPRANETDAHSVAQRILKSSSSAFFEKHPEFSFSVSIGMYSGIPGADDLLQEFIVRADNALYAAKRAGKKRVEIVSPPVPCAGDAALSEGESRP